MSKTAPTQREIEFVKNFSLSIYTMRLAKFYIQMARAYCSNRKVVNILRVAELSTDARIAEMTMFLKDESRRLITEDITGEELMALGSILHEVVDLPSIVEFEQDLISLIRQAKIVQNEKLAQNT